MTGRPLTPPPLPVGGLGVPGRGVARLLRAVRLVAAATLVVLASTAWSTDWPIPVVGPRGAVAVLVAWLLVTNLWSWRHDRGGVEDAGVTVEVCSDLALVATVSLAGGTVATGTVPLAAVLVVVELAVRWPLRRAAVATGLFSIAWAVAVVARWPQWAGWAEGSTVTHLVTPLVSVPVALLLVGWLARDRAQTRDVAIGQARRLALVARQLRAANDQLAGSNEELSAFAARIAHDLRSPLATVVMALETLDRPGAEVPEETRAQLLGQARRAAARSIDTIQALLDHASAGGRAAEVVLVDLHELADEVVGTLPATLLGTVDVALPEPPAPAWADPHLLALVLQNLVTNALAHGGPGLRRIVVGTQHVDGAIVVSVEDDGIGIPADREQELFTAGGGGAPTSGLGLGMATCRSIVERHGGRIWVGPSELGGAAVRFTLPDPVHRPAALDAPPHPHTAPVVLDLDASDDQRTLATSSSSGSSSRTSSSPYRPGSAPTTSRTSRPIPSARRTNPSTV